jgi:phage tail-like protein
VPETGARTDPALGFRFEVSFDGLPPAGFSDCSGLAAETEVHEYVEGGLNTNVHRFPTRTKHGNITLKRGVVDTALWTWYDQLVQGVVRRRDATIVVHTPDGDGVAAEWILSNAFPCKWTGPDLAGATSAVAVETFELCHEGLRRVA